nr:hypothetical protein [Tanacetum cinerariifolium]
MVIDKIIPTEFSLSYMVSEQSFNLSVKKGYKRNFELRLPVARRGGQLLEVLVETLGQLARAHKQTMDAVGHPRDVGEGAGTSGKSSQKANDHKQILPQGLHNDLTLILDEL